MGDGPSTRTPADAPADDASSPWLATWALPVGLVSIVGASAPLQHGLLLPLVGVVALLAITQRRAWIVHRWLRARGGWSGALRDASPLQRAVLVALVALPVALLVTVAARGVGSVVVAYPAALWGVAMAAVGACGVAVVQGRARLPVAVVFAILVPAAGVWGARYEAGAQTAQGWAQSGPIHGIHPFQTAAVVVDGYGPFDIPINDYVEPDGTRGYGPAELADAIERALHRAAELHFADGPHRARKALLEAEAGHRVTAPVRERLDREPNEPEHPRFWVRSGTWGQRSRVEFVCPGRRDGPSGTRDDTVMNRMCPDKYASEASAGLGVTGRWPGYAEGRGNERLGLSRLFGWTRSDDAQGRHVVEREVRSWAWIVLVAAGVWVLVGRARGAIAMRAVAGGVGLLAVIAVVASVGAVDLRVGWIENAAPSTDPWAVRGWLAVLALGGGLWLLDRPGGGDPAARAEVPRVTAVAGVAAALVVCTCLVASHLAASSWIVPRLWAPPDAGVLAFETWVMNVADVIGPRGTLDILEVESAVAAALAVGLLGLAASSVALVARATAHATESPPFRVAAVGVVLAVAAALVVSRKTGGGETLVHGAIGLTLVLGSGLSVLARRHGPAAPRSMGIPAAIHVGWCLLGAAMVVASARAAPSLAVRSPWVVAHPFVLLCAAVGLAAVLGGLTLLVGKRAPPGPRSDLGATQPEDDA